MEIIGHTASINKNRFALQHFLIAYPCNKIKLDFILTKDGKLVWTHNSKVNGNIVSNSNYRDVSNLLTLEDVLEILNNEIQLLVEIKHFHGFHSLQFTNLLKALEILEACNFSIQSFNQNLIRELLKIREDFSVKEIGLIINLFKTFSYRNGNIYGLEELDFISLSSELWEWEKIREDYKYYRKLFPNVKQFAWTWSTIYHENGERIMNYIEKGADGIITEEPALVRALVRKY